MDAEDLKNSLNQFIGTERYYRINPRAVLTDRTKYLADTAKAYWLFDAIASYLPKFTGLEDFVVAELTVTGSKAELILENGNGLVLDSQRIEYTDFPLPSIQLFACWGGEFWVLMLPNEY
jgi:hypothetical protein